MFDNRHPYKKVELGGRDIRKQRQGFQHNVFPANTDKPTCAVPIIGPAKMIQDPLWIKAKLPCASL